MLPWDVWLWTQKNDYDRVYTNHIMTNKVDLLLKGFQTLDKSSIASGTLDLATKQDPVS
jgi:hypothetical protein